MKRIFFVLKALVLVAGSALSLCSLAPVAGGNSSQTGNSGITVSAVSNSLSGTTAPGARVYVYEKKYRPYVTPSGYCDSTVSDDSGKFALSITMDGYFNLVVNDDKRGVAGYLPGIPVFADSLFHDTLDTLRRPGFISGNATDTSGQIFALSYVFILGTPFYTVTRNNGDFLLGPLPAATYVTGFFANFQVVNLNTGLMAQTPSPITDTTIVTVVPDGVSQWKW
jgi:hypothetical protein